MNITDYHKASNLVSEITNLESEIKKLEEICEQGEMPYGMELHFEFWNPMPLSGPRNDNKIESFPHSEDLMNFFKTTLKDYKNRLAKAEKELEEL